MENMQCDPGQQIDGYQVDHVHHDDPQKNRQCQRRDETAVAVDNRLALLFDHVDDHFNKGLEAARHARSDALGDVAQRQQRDDQAQHGKNDRVEIDDGKIDDRLLFVARQVRQVVNDIFGRGRSFTVAMCNFRRSCATPPSGTEAQSDSFSKRR